MTSSAHLDRRAAWILPLLLAPLVTVLILFNPNWIVFALAVASLVLLPLAVRDEPLALLGLLILRPIADIVGEGVQFNILDRYTINLASLLSLGVLAWSIIVFLRHRLRFWQQPLFWPFFAFVAVGAVSIMVSEAPDRSVTEVVRLASILVVYLLAQALLRTAQHLHAYRAALLLSLAVPAALAAVQFLTHTGLSFGDVGNRVYGTFGHPNAFAFFLLLNLVFLGTTYLGTPRERRSLPLGLVCLGIALLLLLTYTRGAWLGAVLVAGVIAMVRFRKIFLMAVMTVVAVVALFPLLNTASRNYLNLDLERTPVVRRLLDQQSDDSSLEFRLRLWSEMRRRFADRPVLGHGLGAFPVVRERQIIGFFQGTEAHNDYLRLAIETGMLGLAAYAWLLLALLRRLFPAYRAVRGTKLALVALGHLGFFLAFLVMSFFDNLLQGTAVMWTFWAMNAVVMNVPKMEKSGSV